jgi:hypothetical protein
VRQGHHRRDAAAEHGQDCGGDGDPTQSPPPPTDRNGHLRWRRDCFSADVSANVNGDLGMSVAGLRRLRTPRKRLGAADSSLVDSVFEAHRIEDLLRAGFTSLGGRLERSISDEFTHAPRPPRTHCPHSP